MDYKLDNDNFASKVKINRSVFVEYLHNLESNLPASKKVSTKQLAKRAGWSMSYTYHIVSQRTGNPLTVVTLSKICQVFGMNNEQSKEWIKQMEKSTHKYQIQNRKLIEKEKNIPDDIERLIRKICSEKHWSLDYLAKSADMNVLEVADIRDGKEKNPDSITLGRLANALNIDVHIMFKAFQITKSERKRMPIIGGGDLADVLSQQIHNQYMPIKLLATKSKVDVSYIKELLKNKGLNHLKYGDMKSIAKALGLNTRTLIIARVKSLQEIVGIIKPAKRTSFNLNSDKDSHFNVNLSKTRDDSYNIRPDVIEVARKLNHASQIDISIINMMVIRVLKAEEADKYNL